MCTQEEVNEATSAYGAALRDQEGNYIGDFYKWIAVEGNNIEDLEFVRLDPVLHD